LPTLKYELPCLGIYPQFCQPLFQVLLALLLGAFMYNCYNFMIVWYYYHHKISLFLPREQNYFGYINIATAAFSSLLYAWHISSIILSSAYLDLSQHKILASIYLDYVLKSNMTILLFLSFCRTGVWTQGFAITNWHSRGTLSHTSSTFCSAYFGDGVSNYLPGWEGLLFPLYPHQHLLLCVLLMIAILTGVKWNLNAILISI
jgi:hypothetical protein